MGGGVPPTYDIKSRPPPKTEPFRARQDYGQLNHLNLLGMAVSYSMVGIFDNLSTHESDLIIAVSSGQAGPMPWGVLILNVDSGRT